MAKKIKGFKTYFNSTRDRINQEHDVPKGFHLNPNGTLSVDHDPTHRIKIKKKPVEEAVEKSKFNFDNYAKQHDDYEHNEDNLDKISHKLVTNTTQIKNHINGKGNTIHDDDDSQSSMHDFSHDSSETNQRLIDGHKAGLSHADLTKDDGITKHSKPIGISHTFFHGTYHDFGSAAESSRGGVIHSPAHLSMSHDHQIAEQFSDEDDNKIKHVLAIHMEPHHKALNIEPWAHSNKADEDYPKSDLAPHSPSYDEDAEEHAQAYIYGGERETVLPAGAKLKHVKTVKTTDGYHVHHFNIHSQE